MRILAFSTLSICAIAITVTAASYINEDPLDAQTTTIIILALIASAAATLFASLSPRSTAPDLD